MALEPSDPLERATRALRQDEEEAQEPRWLELSESIMTRVRGISWPAARVLASDPEGRSDRDTQGSRTYVSSRVVRDALRRALTTSQVEPKDIDLRVVDDHLQRLDLELVATYAQDLQEVGHWARGEALRVLDEQLGPLPDLDPDADVSITITDLHDDDARLGGAD